MNPKRREVRSRWGFAASGAVAALAATLWMASLVRIPAPARIASDPLPAFAVLPAGNPTLHDETLMTDLTPLFLPTERNARLPNLPLRLPGHSFLDADPLRLAYGDAGPRLVAKLPPAAELNGKPMTAVGPLDAVATETTIPLALGFGRADKVAAPLPARGGVVEVVSMETAEKVLVTTLPSAARPPTTQLWQPLELTALVNAAGLVGPLETTASSRVEAVDHHFRNYLVQTYRIASRLPPGYYRITVGP